MHTHESKHSEPQIHGEPKPPFPEQHLEGTGAEWQLSPRPRYEGVRYRPAGKLEGKVALVTGGDSGIGRAVAVLYAREGADVAIVYNTHDEDAAETARKVQEAGRRCVCIQADVGSFVDCERAVEKTVGDLGRLDIVVSNAAFQQHAENLEDIPDEQLERTFRTNVFGYFYIVKAALRHLEQGSAIIATGSETGLFGSGGLLDYSATKGAIHALTRSLAQNLLKRGIRVNAVAPGPVWTPLNPADAGVSKEKVAHFGEQSELGRPAQPEEIAPAYVFLASDPDASFITGQVLPALGGASG